MKLASPEKSDFVDLWESGTRRIEPAKPGRRTRWLMKQSTAQHGGIRISLRNRQKVGPAVPWKTATRR